MTTNANQGEVIKILEVLDLEFAVDPEETIFVLDAIAYYFERIAGRLDRS